MTYTDYVSRSYLSCNNGAGQRIQIGVASSEGHYLGIFTENGVSLFDVNSGVSKGFVPFTPFQVISATSASTALSANTPVVVDYQFTVPAGYTIVSVQDDSYYAGIFASPIKIFERDASTGKQKVTFNYLSIAGASARTYTAKALAVRM